MKFGTPLGASAHFTTPPLTAWGFVVAWLFDAEAMFVIPRVATIATEIAAAPARQSQRLWPLNAFMPKTPSS
jgi:branched-subunit amino acid permease